LSKREGHAQRTQPGG